MRWRSGSEATSGASSVTAGGRVELPVGQLADGHLRMPQRLARGVDDGAPQPAFERAVAAVGAPAADRVRERVLDGLGGGLRVARDRACDAEERTVPAPVELLDPVEEGVGVRAHLPK
jgi:hypothetical protein